jgi:hypothetical protein
MTTIAAEELAFGKYIALTITVIWRLKKVHVQRK